MNITAQTTDEDLERIPYLDMRAHAAQLRDWAATTETSDGVLLIASEAIVASYTTDADGWAVLFEAEFGTATVNRWTVGVGNSVIVEDVWSAAEAVEKVQRGGATVLDWDGKLRAAEEGDHYITED